MSPLRIGVDLGGTKIEVVAINDRGEIQNRLRKPTPAGDYEGILSQVVELVNTVAGGSSNITVGIGTPGSVNPVTGLQRNSNSTCLNGRPFARDLKSALGVPSCIANDANCFALSESRDGAGAGARVDFGVILGTGCGGGIVVDGKLVEGLNGIGGEWGHMALPRRDGQGWEPRPCYCGRSDCLEQYLSGTSLQEEYARESGRRLVMKDIVAQVDTDLHAKAVLDRFYDRLAESLVSVVNLLDPDVIVLGGGLSNLDSIYDAVPKLVHERAFSDLCTTPIVKNVHGDSSGVLGAARLLDHLHNFN